VRLEACASISFLEVHLSSGNISFWSHGYVNSQHIRINMYLLEYETAHEHVWCIEWQC